MKSNSFIIKMGILGATFLGSFNCNAQLVAEAGPDKVICQYWYGIDTATLGGNPTASGGVPPYTYSWEVNHTHTIGQNTFTNVASQFM